MTTINTQQVLSQAVVGAMSVSIMATAMGIMMGAAGAEAYKVKPTELKGTQAAVHDLKLAFGSKVVDQAVKNVGVDSMLTLAKEVEKLIIEDMNAKYGPLATEAALAAAPPGDVAAAKEIANTLSNRGVKAEDWKGWLETAPVKVRTQVVEGAIKRKKIKHPAKPVLDTKTNLQYRSKSAAGMTVAAEYGLDPTDTYVWYEIIKKDPKRFKEIGATA